VLKIPMFRIALGRLLGMPVFGYEAVDARLAHVSGTLVAATPREARDMLRERGLTVQTVTGAEESRGSGRWWLGRRSVSGAKVVSFIRELSTLLAVGIPLLDAIDAIHKQHRGRFGAALLNLRDRVSSGIGLAEAMREQPGVFDEMCVSLTEVGENTGTLDTALERVADFKERQAALRNKLATALIYPLIVLIMAIGVSLLLMTVVVPNLLGTLADAGRPLPLPTRIVKFASDWLVHRWWVLLIVAIAIVVGVRLILIHPRGRLAWHRAQLRLPIAGDLIRKQAIVRLCVILSTLLRSGTVFIRAIQIARKSVPNAVLNDALVRCEEAVGAGRDISAALDETGAFPPVVVQVFSVGQQSGRLEEMLDRLATDYDRQVSVASQRLAAILEPVLILALVLLVGFIGLATILPMLEAASAL
jgi:general secretion pathway protein F